jgi:hypothetical protein
LFFSYTKSWEFVCDEHGIGGGGEYCGNNDNDAQIGRINMLYHINRINWAKSLHTRAFQEFF